MTIDCPECKKKISEKAKSCPNCGYPLSEEEIQNLIKEKKQGEKVASIGCISVIVIVLLVLIKPWSSNSSDSHTYQEPKNKSLSEKSVSMAYKLAVLEKQSYVSENDILVKRFESLLNQLDSKYVDDQEKIADVTVAGIENLAKRGIEESMITLMEGMVQIYDSSNDYMVYHEYSASYVVLRIQGRPHQETLKILQQMINEYGIKRLLRALEMGSKDY